MPTELTELIRLVQEEGTSNLEKAHKQDLGENLQNRSLEEKRA